MLIILSPSKTQDFSTPIKGKTTQALLLEESKLLLNSLKELSQADISKLMDVSEKIAELNFNRFQEMTFPFDTNNAKQALFAFRGDVYDGLAGHSLNENELKYAQKHLRILSGLYGFLKPNDLIQAYRLEMKTPLQNIRGKNLYEFWGDRITNEINHELLNSKENTLVNLASEEYFKVVKTKLINGNIITPIFKEYKNGKYSIIGIFAKKARGLMARFIIENQIKDIKKIKSFDVAGYHYEESFSNENDWVFIR